MGQLLRYPVDYVGITQYFSATNRGIDIGWRDVKNPPIYAAANGIVYSSAKRDIYGGLYVVLQHDDLIQGRRVLTRYWHLQSIAVKEGQSVKLGQQIGIMGNTGNTTGVHLHLEVNIFPAGKTGFTESQCRAAAVDPLLYVYKYADQQLNPAETRVKQYNGTIADQLAYDAQVAAIGGLNIRSNPPGLKTGTLKYGTVVQLIRERDGWGELSMGGWVSLKYIKKI